MTTRRNCWTCRWDARPACARLRAQRGEVPDAVRAWVIDLPDVDFHGMPPREADGCPGYEPVESGGEAP